MHNDACKEWICLTPAGAAGPTLVAFEPHFTTADQLLHKMQTLILRAGYTANNVFEEELHYQTAEALAQLAEATSSDRATVADLASANTQLMEQVANYITRVSAKDSEIATLYNSIKN
eukprot:11038534-Ditylum_brightwellii.AAC.1